MKRGVLLNSILVFIILFFFPYKNFGQNPINVIQSNQFKQIEINDTIFQKFSGNVIIEYSDLKINCDTIMIDQYKDNIRGWGNVHVSNDTLTCLSDSAIIKQLNNTVTFLNNSVVTTSDIKIISHNIKYDFKEEIISYSNSGTVTMDNLDVKSLDFKYDLDTKKSFFDTNIYLSNSEYIIEGHNMIYNNQVLSFFGPTQISHTDFIMNCQQGSFEQNKNLEVIKGLTIQYDNKTVNADYLIRNLQKNENIFKNNIRLMINDSTHVFGDNLFEKDDIATITKNCKIKLLNATDSTIIQGDTIMIKNNGEEARVAQNVKINSNNLQGNCQLIKFTSNYTEMTMLDNPVLWFNEVQITGSEINIYCIQNELDSMYIPANPLIIEPQDANYYNQITGKKMMGKFKNQKIQYVHIDGNGQMIYFNNQNDNLSVNNVKAGSIKLNFDSNLIEQVMCFEQIESNYREIEYKNLKDINKSLLYLNNFNLREKNSF